MSNCDFGSPCTCTDCRTTYVDCESCGEKRSVKVIQNAKAVTGRKGESYYEFSRPLELLNNLNCEKCKPLTQFSLE